MFGVNLVCFIASFQNRVSIPESGNIQSSPNNSGVAFSVDPLCKRWKFATLYQV